MKIEKRQRQTAAARAAMQLKRRQRQVRKHHRKPTQPSKEKESKAMNHNIEPHQLQPQRPPPTEEAPLREKDHKAKNVVHHLSLPRRSFRQLGVTPTYTGLDSDHREDDRGKGNKKNNNMA